MHSIVRTDTRLHNLTAGGIVKRYLIEASSPAATTTGIGTRVTV